MRRRGQGSMEYLMTYGWAILIIIILGVALWSLGVKKPSKAPPHITGDSTIKLEAAQTQFRRDILGPQTYGTYTHGFITMGLNTLPVTMRITEVNLSVDGKSCQYMYAWVAPPAYIDFTKSYLQRTCSNNRFTCGAMTCTGTKCKGTSPRYLELPVGGRLMIATSSNRAFFQTAGNENDTCYDIQSVNRHVTLAITYQDETGGVLKTKTNFAAVSVEVDDLAGYGD